MVFCQTARYITARAKLRRLAESWPPISPQFAYTRTFCGSSTTGKQQHQSQRAKNASYTLRPCGWCSVERSYLKLWSQKILYFAREPFFAFSVSILYVWVTVLLSILVTSLHRLNVQIFIHYELWVYRRNKIRWLFTCILVRFENEYFQRLFVAWNFKVFGR